MPIGIPELLIVLAIVLVLYGGRKLPELGRGLGAGMREFKDSLKGSGKGDDEQRDRLTPGDEVADDEPLTGEIVAERRR